jgi:exosortase
VAALTEVVRSTPWRAAAAGLLCAVAIGFFGVIGDLVGIWSKYADYSHGFLVPPFAAYLLWRRRSMLPTEIRWPDSLGLVPLLLGIAMAVAGGVTNYAKELAQGLGLILALVGVLMLLLSRAAMKWAWPGLAFLLFMLKMPDRIEVAFLIKLRQIATEGSNFLLQTLGYPAYIAGNQGTTITVLTDPEPVRLGVEWACSGLSMVLTFVAVAAAVALFIQRPVADKLFVLASALPIAVVSNVIRITVTALVYIAGWKWLGDAIVHDLAGWLMMPLALAFLALELKFIDFLFPPPPPEVDRDSVLKDAAKVATATWVVKTKDEPAPPPAEGAAR